MSKKEELLSEIKKLSSKIGSVKVYPESVKPINSKIPKCRLQAGKQSRKPHPHCT